MALPGSLHDPQLLLQEPLLATASAVVVALSGGLDSSVLLHLFARLRTLGLRAPLSALHVQHGLQREAEAWLEHCRTVCAALDVPFVYERLQLGNSATLSSTPLPLTGEGLKLPSPACGRGGGGEGKEESDESGANVSEDTARTARYAAFAKHLPQGGVLLHAHHRQDQVETVLFRFLRGSGVRGLGGMPKARRFAAGWLLRPLLDLPRTALAHYAQEHALTWVEDPSNAEPHYTRNFLRQRILPVLQERWPALERQIQQSAEHSLEAAALLEELAEMDLRTARGPHLTMLSLSALAALSPARRRNLLRHWYRHAAGPAAPLLPATLLDALQRELLTAAPDAAPCWRWGEAGRGGDLRRYGAYLYLVPPLPMLPEQMTLVAGAPLDLPAPLGRLTWRETPTGGLALAKGEALHLRFRQGGERLKPVGRPTRELKKFLQERGIAPWLRDYVPLIYRGAELIAVADFTVAETAAAKAGENALQLVWERPDLHCGA
jgi:tRNA(Ile)-lysidine synthase